MTDYEILLMLDPELPDERQTEIVTRSRELIERDGGSFDAHQPWGRRRLSYEIDHKTDGSYHLLTFAAEPATLEEISRVLKITDGVMRHLAVRRVQGASMRPPEPAPEERVAARPAPRQDAGAETDTASETENETESVAEVAPEPAAESAPEAPADEEPESAETTAESTA
jgi:small subunit ribosomal protein S6